jgi:hypothetical protein
MEKCTVIKLLHRTDISKKVLIKNIEQKNTNWWFYKEIESICERLRIEPEELCFYPDKTRRRLRRRLRRRTRRRLKEMKLKKR